MKGLRPTHSPKFPKIYLLVLTKKINLFICFKHDESCPPGWAPMGFFGTFVFCPCSCCGFLLLACIEGHPKK